MFIGARVCNLSWRALPRKGVISQPAKMDEHLGSWIDCTEAARSRCCDGENLIAVVRRKAKIVFLISVQAA